MPDRILRQTITTSKSLAAVPIDVEAFYVHLWVVVDDYGRYFADPYVLLSATFPRRPEVKASFIEEALSALSAAGMIVLYEATNGAGEAEQYLQIVSWERHQRMRARKSKYPGPENGTVAAICRNLPQSAATRGNVPPKAKAKDKDKDKDKDNVPSGAAEAISHWNEIVTSLPKATLTDARKKRLDALLASHGGQEGLSAIWARVEASDFLTGRSGAWSGCGIDWVLKPANFQKITEGNYDNRPGKGTSRQGRKDANAGNFTGRAYTADDWAAMETDPADVAGLGKGYGSGQEEE